MEKENLSILVIDPEKNDHQLIRDSLKRSKVPASLHFVTSTEKGLQEIGKKKFDLVLTDHSLPEANAFHLLFELQHQEENLPVIVLTHDGEARIAREAFQRGVDDYLLKAELETTSLFDVFSNAIEKRHQREEKKSQELLLRELAERDGLTGLYNHRYFVDMLEREFARARRYHRPLSLVMVDLDGFKAINDACGHPQGDLVLKQISRLLLQTLRFVDVVARYGGDEFVLVLPETEVRQAMKLAGRILEEIRQNPFFNSQDGKTFPLSASIGVACYRPQHSSAGHLLKEADRALYEAKKKGRDQVVSTETPSSSPLRLFASH
jgi:two-component system cell cycle response regulator